MKSILFAILYFTGGMASAGIPVIDTSTESVCYYADEASSVGAVIDQDGEPYVCCSPAGSIETTYWDKVLSDNAGDMLVNCKTYVF